MPTKKTIIEELQWLSDRISTQVRTLGIGLLAITWGLLITKPDIVYPLSENLKKNLLIVGIVALMAMVYDFLQYFFAYLNTRRLLGKTEREKLTEVHYDYSAIYYKLRNFFFWAKQIFLLIACVWFFIVIIPFCIKAVLNTGTK